MNAKVIERLTCVMNEYRREIIEKLSEKYGFNINEALCYLETEKLPEEVAAVAEPKVKKTKEAAKAEPEVKVVVAEPEVKVVVAEPEVKKAKAVAKPKAKVLTEEEKEAEKAKKLLEKEAEKAKKLSEKKQVAKKEKKEVVVVPEEPAISEDEEELDEEEIEEDEVEELKLKAITFNGKKYGRAPDNSVFDLETQEEVGVWNDEKKEVEFA